MAQWSAESSRHIVYRAIAYGQLVLQTPAHFGIGEQDGTHLVISQDPYDGSPLLTGASQAGALRHYLLRRERGYRTASDSSTAASRLFGEALDEYSANHSRLIVHDAYGTSRELGLRNGVKIAGETRTADDGALFNVQVWPEGTTFNICLELYICWRDNADLLKQAFAVVLQALAQGEIPLGARKHRGYGRCQVTSWQISEYDLTQCDDFLAWVAQLETPVNPGAFLASAASFADKRERVRLEADFDLCDSLMIRVGEDVVDATHLTTHSGQPLLSGTSIAGALRARSLKILKTWWPSSDAEALVNDMFGVYGDETEAGQQLTASRLHVKEHALSSARMDRVQSRVKIDRFTGGAYGSALLSEQPAFATPDTSVHLELELHYPADEDSWSWLNKETGLLLLLIKDLWTQDLVLGGEGSIGRGRLKGRSATLTIAKGKEAEEYIFGVNGLLNPAQADKLQCYVDVLWEDA